MVHASHPYKAVGNTTVSRTLSFVFLHCPFQIEIIFVNRVVAIASLLLISGVLFPFAEIKKKKKQPQNVPTELFSRSPVHVVERNQPTTKCTPKYVYKSARVISHVCAYIKGN